MIQGDIVSPIFFVLALDQLVQTLDANSEGNSVGHINKLSILGYADDAAMLALDVDTMTARLTKFADGALAEADMRVKTKKTFNQLVQAQAPVGKATTLEIKDKVKSYAFKCEFADAGCTARFKTKSGMLKHVHHCTFKYSYKSEEAFEIEKIVGVFGKIECRLLFLVRWRNQPGQDSWEPEHPVAGRMQTQHRRVLDKNGAKPFATNIQRSQWIAQMLDLWMDKQKW